MKTANNVHAVIAALEAAGVQLVISNETDPSVPILKNEDVRK